MMKRKIRNSGEFTVNKKQKTRSQPKHNTKSQTTKDVIDNINKVQNGEPQKPELISFPMDIWVHCISKHLDEKSFLNLFTISMTFYEYFLDCVKERAEYLCNRLPLLCFQSKNYNKKCRYYMCFPNSDYGNSTSMLTGPGIFGPVPSYWKPWRPPLVCHCGKKTLYKDTEKHIIKMCSPVVKYLIRRLTAFKSEFGKRSSHTLREMMKKNIAKIWCSEYYRLGYLYRYLVYLSDFDVKELDLPNLKNAVQKVDEELIECNQCNSS